MYSPLACMMTFPQFGWVVTVVVTFLSTVTSLVNTLPMVDSNELTALMSLIALGARLVMTM